MKRRDQIGFSQRIHLDWLEYTANLVLAGNPRQEIVAALSERLKEKLLIGNEPERGNHDKAITILTKVWVAIPRELQTLRDEGSITFGFRARPSGCWCTGACAWRILRAYIDWGVLTETEEKGLYRG